VTRAWGNRGFDPSGHAGATLPPSWPRSGFGSEGGHEGCRRKGQGGAFVASDRVGSTKGRRQPFLGDQHCVTWDGLKRGQGVAAGDDCRVSLAKAASEVVDCVRNELGYASKGRPNIGCCHVSSSSSLGSVEPGWTFCGHMMATAVPHGEAQLRILGLAG
jgi:hypothetical protein